MNTQVDDQSPWDAINARAVAEGVHHPHLTTILLSLSKLSMKVIRSVGRARARTIQRFRRKAANNAPTPDDHSDRNARPANPTPPNDSDQEP